MFQDTYRDFSALFILSATESYGEIEMLNCSSVSELKL